MGRTGRHREGRVVYVLAAGKETDNYHRSQEEMRRLQALLRDAPRVFELSRSSPPMLPTGCHPRPVMLRLQEAAAAVVAHQKQQQAVAKKQTGKRAAAGGAAGTADTIGAPGAEGGAAKRRRGITSATGGGGSGGEKHLTAAQQAAAARWAKRPVGHDVITIDDDAVGGDDADETEDAEVNMPLAQRVLAKIRQVKQQQQQPRRLSSGAVPSLKPLWGSQDPLDDDEDPSMFDWAREIYNTKLPGGGGGGGGGAKAAAGDAAGAAVGGRGYCSAVGEMAPAVAGPDAVAAVTVAGDGNGAAVAHGSSVEANRPAAALEARAPTVSAAEMPAACTAAAADGIPTTSTPHVLSDGQTQTHPEPHTTPDPGVATTATAAAATVDVPSAAAAAGSPKPLRHIMLDPAPHGTTASHRPAGGIAASGLWLSPQLTAALHNLLLGPSTHGTRTGTCSGGNGQSVDQSPPHHSTETPNRKAPKADTASHGSVGFLEALLKPISDDEAAELVAAAGDHPIARLAAAFKPQPLNYRPPPTAPPHQPPKRDLVPAVRQGTAGLLAQGDSLQQTGTIGPSALCANASAPMKPNEHTQCLVYEVGQGPKDQSSHQNASGSPTAPHVAVTALARSGCAAAKVTTADPVSEVLELLSDDSGSKPGCGDCVGGGDTGRDDDFDPDNIIVTLDVVPLAARKPTGHTASAKRESTRRVSAVPTATKRSTLKHAGVTASVTVASPRSQEAVAAAAAAAAAIAVPGYDDDGLQDVPLAARRRLSAAAAAVATAARPSLPSERDCNPAAPGFRPATSPENRWEFIRGGAGYSSHENGLIDGQSNHQLDRAGTEAARSC
ncbi:hypothetical protein Vafri_11814, partial [Volvox africanus]